MTLDDLRSLPFYADRLSGSSVLPWTIDDLEDFAKRTDDGFAGRLRGTSPVSVALQIEATGEPPVWTALEPAELEAWARGLSRVWDRLGLRDGDSIAFFDYGSNPAVLLSSSIYVSHLKRGAAERLGASTVCNDGVASMTARLWTILEAVQPAALLVRRDLIAPLADLAATRGLPVGGRLRWAIVGETEGAPAEAEARRLADVLGVPVRRMLRADAAFLLAADCLDCGLFHLDRRLHEVRSLGDEGVALTARFAERCPAVGYRLDGARLEKPGCLAERSAPRIAWR